MKSIYLTSIFTNHAIDSIIFFIREITRDFNGLMLIYSVGFRFKALPHPHEKKNRENINTVCIPILTGNHMVCDTAPIIIWCRKRHQNSVCIAF